MTRKSLFLFVLFFLWNNSIWAEEELSCQTLDVKSKEMIRRVPCLFLDSIGLLEFRRSEELDFEDSEVEILVSHEFADLIFSEKPSRFPQALKKSIAEMYQRFLNVMKRTFDVSLIEQMNTYRILILFENIKTEEYYNGNQEKRLSAYQFLNRKEKTAHILVDVNYLDTKGLLLSLAHEWIHVFCDINGIDFDDWLNEATVLWFQNQMKLDLEPYGYLELKSHPPFNRQINYLSDPLSTEGGEPYGFFFELLEFFEDPGQFRSQLASKFDFELLLKHAFERRSFQSIYGSKNSLETLEWGFDKAQERDWFLIFEMLFEYARSLVAKNKLSPLKKKFFSIPAFSMEVVTLSSESHALTISATQKIWVKSYRSYKDVLLEWDIESFADTSSFDFKEAVTERFLFVFNPSPRISHIELMQK